MEHNEDGVPVITVGAKGVVRVVQVDDSGATVHEWMVGLGARAHAASMAIDIADE